MILDQMVEVRTTVSNAKHFENLGYEIEYHIDRDGVKRLKQKTLCVPASQLPLYSRVVVKAKCDNCGSIFEKPNNFMAKYKVHNCSTKCMGEYKAAVFLKEFESLIGRDAKDFLHQKYVIEKMTTREIAELVYGKKTSASSINRWIVSLGIELRQGSEAIKTQWIGNDTRRKLVAKLAKENFFTKEALEKRQESLNSPESKRRQRYHKTGKNNPMYGVRGEAHPRWDDSITDEERVNGRKTIEDVAWRRKVYKRDKYTCQVCGEYRRIKVNAHHYLNHKTYENLRYEVDNGVTVCESCHVQFHKTYGYFDNTREQFEEYQKTFKQISIL